MKTTITDRYALRGLNRDFMSHIHNRLEDMNNDDSDFFEVIDSGNTVERLAAIDDKIFEIKQLRLVIGRNLQNIEILEALTELKERLQHRRKGK